MKCHQKLLWWYEHYMTVVGAGGHMLFVFQILRIIQTRSSNDVSFMGFFVASFSIYSWLVYGYLVNDKVLIRVNLVGALLSTVCLVTIIWFG
jgi:uncharacterized protein with PQ loop repeat